MSEVNDRVMVTLGSLGLGGLGTRTFCVNFG